MGKAKSYAERLFEFPEIGALSMEDAKLAIAKPANAEGVEIEPPALGRHRFFTLDAILIFCKSGASMYGMLPSILPSPHPMLKWPPNRPWRPWMKASSWFRFDRLTPSEKRYVRAMAQLGAGPHRSGDIAHELGRSVSSLAPLRNQLINKGMIWSPSHGDTGFTVPMFDEFMVRIIPSDEWRSSV